MLRGEADRQTLRGEADRSRDEKLSCHNWMLLTETNTTSNFPSFDRLQVDAIDRSVCPHLAHQQFRAATTQHIPLVLMAVRARTIIDSLLT